MRMTRTLKKLIPVILMFSSLLRSPLRGEAAQTQAVVDGNTAFALDLYAQLKTSPGNLFFSPHSISTALAMTYAGARGDTEKQMAGVLYFHNDQGQLHSAFGELQRQLRERSKEQGI